MNIGLEGLPEDMKEQSPDRNSFIKLKSQDKGVFERYHFSSPE